MNDICVNRKARFDYEIIETHEAGMVLLGSEVKSLRNGNANLRDSYAIVKGEEVFLINAHIAKYPPANIFNHDPTRTRKLLLKKLEIRRLTGKIKEKGLTLIPLKIYFNKDGVAKTEIGLAKGRRKYEKKEEIKKRDIEREIRSEKSRL
ncbi:MAG TPA: SsrA-binding protein SmpB [bacterium]